MHKGFLKAAAILGALAVMLGAFAAHGLKEQLPANQLAIFDTGVRYQFYHVFALLAVGILYKEFPKKLLRTAGLFFYLGILFFSGSLYFLTYFKIEVTSGNKLLFLITPLGGLCFIIGWLLLAAAFFKKN